MAVYVSSMKHEDLVVSLSSGKTLSLRLNDAAKKDLLSEGREVAVRRLTGIGYRYSDARFIMDEAQRKSEPEDVKTLLNVIERWETDKLIEPETPKGTYAE